MVFLLLVLCLIAAVFVYQAKTGLYSALIMVSLTICCAGLAYGTFEWVGNHFLVGLWKADFGMALSLALTFGVPLLALRLAADHWLRRACLLPVMVDRIGAGVCAAVTALIMTGVAVTCVQMLPFNGAILGFARLPVYVKISDRSSETVPDPAAGENELFLRPDRFSYAVAAVLSDGVFSSRRSLRDEYPDFVQAVGQLNAVPTEVSRYAPNDSVSVVRTRRLQFVYRYTPGEAGSGRNSTPTRGTYGMERAKPGHEFQMVRVRLGNDARDANRSHIFSLRQFRLVGREDADGPARQFFPLAIQQNDIPADEVDTTQYHISKRRGAGGDWSITADVLRPRDGNNDQVEVVFEVPVGLRPEYIAYKWSARAAVTFGGSVDEPLPPTTEAPPPASPPTERRQRTPSVESTSGRGGNVRGVATSEGQSFFGDAMPLTMRSYQRLKNAEVSRGALTGGHLVGNVQEQEAGSDRAVRRFSVPSGKRLLHLDSEYLRARSTLGGAMTFAVNTVQNYIVTDATGRQYRVCGKYARATVENEEVLEVQYFSEPVGSIGGLSEFHRIKEQHFTGEYQLVLLFLVEPGARLVSFTSGGSASRQEDLTDQNLVAPN